MNDVASPTALSKLSTIRTPLWLPLLFALLLILVYGWKSYALGKAQDALEAQRIELTEKAEREKADIVNRANTAISKYSDDAHALFGESLSWSVRGEMMQGNLGQVEQFLTKLVQTENIQLAAYADASGRILSASDAKLQGAQFSEHFQADLLNAPGVAVLPGKDGQKMVVLPVQGLTERLGTVVVSYTPEAPISAK